ncbi:hypothetical protein AOCH_002514 [Aspergillus ochraceoroseus]|uniref:ASST-domain-containing protein n=1 Tax=Aspergillus ochraceoroseus TaxID=138278 RepID=A0A0F8UK39_9EURO|nr:hypothetical protein AOCH_002514 [Aspergillus ochraceoroseus]
MFSRTWTIPRGRRRNWHLHLGGGRALAIAIIITSIIYIFDELAVPQLLRIRPRLDLSWYDLGIYGFGPSQSYISFEYDSPLVEISQTGVGCDPRYSFLAPRGDSIAHPGPMIMDAEGNLVWMKHNWEITQDFKVQRYQDTDYLTYWEGSVTEGRGYGSWYMLDSTYTTRYVITPAGNFGGDLHEFHITPQGTALLAIYDPIPADLTPVGGLKLGWLYDCVFQEIDIATGDLLFEWRASEYVPINNTYHQRQGTAGKDRESAFDFFHLNSIDQDDEGNYIISSRHMHTISCIDRHTGEILWTLGGKTNEFKDLSDGEATNFAWQHDARWHANSTLTLLDNGSHAYSDPERQSRGLVIQLDIANREARRQGAYYHPQEFKSVSQGNLQKLDDRGRVLVGWGHSAAYSEYSADGQMLCDVHFAASAFFLFGRVVSYRVFKGAWVGNPQTPPDAEVMGDMIYASWNGATEAVAWQLEAWDSHDSGDSDDFADTHFHRVELFEKTGFETEIKIPESLESPLFRLAALDSQGTVLGTTGLLQRDSRLDLDELLNLHDWVIRIAVAMSACGLITGLYCIVNCRRCLRRHHSRKNDYQLVPLQ